jgi:hypothetical protein
MKKDKSRPDRDFNAGFGPSAEDSTVSPRLLHLEINPYLCPSASSADGLFPISLSVNAPFVLSFGRRSV